MSENNDAVTSLPAEWLADIRLRAMQKMGLCLHEHTIHRREDDPERDIVWVTCDDDPDEPTQLGSIVLPRSSSDPSHEVRDYVVSTIAEHERTKAGDVVLTLLAALGA